LLPVEFERPAEPVPEALLLELPLRPVLLPLVPEPDVSAEVMPDAPVPELPAPEVPVPEVPLMSVVPVVDPVTPEVPVVDDPDPEVSGEELPDVPVPDMPIEPVVEPVEPEPELPRVLDVAVPVFDPVLVEPVADELDRPPPAPIEVSSMLRRDRQSALAGVVMAARASKAVV